MLVAPLERLGNPASVVVSSGVAAAAGAASATAGVSETNLSGSVLTLVAPLERLGKPALVVSGAAVSAVTGCGASISGASISGADSGSAGGVPSPESNTCAFESALACVASTWSVRRATASEAFSSVWTSLATSWLRRAFGRSMNAIVPRRWPSPVGSALDKRTVTPISWARRPTTNSPRYADGASAKSTGFCRRSFT